MKTWILATLLTAAPVLGQAAGLGELRVSSKLGQPLQGEIRVVSIKPGEEELSARIASLEQFEKANLTPRPGVVGARLSIVTVKGKTVILIKGTQSVNEPAFDVLVELTWPGGQVLRAYKVLLERPKI